jgi:riboflavin biosynthesis pyrimidine reductase
MTGWRAGRANIADVSPTLRRLFPEPTGDVTVDDYYTDERRLPIGTRPWVMVTMICSVDGSTAIAGRSGGLGNDTDAAALRATRTNADVLLVGAGTVRAEGYGPPRIPGLRIGVVTRTGSVDPSSPLFTSGAGFLIVPRSAPTHGLPAVRCGDNEVDLTLALSALGDLVQGASVVGCEGGPRLNGALADAGYIDELNLTVSPRISGGGGSRLTAGAEPTRLDLELAGLAVDGDGYLFSRWLRRS